jgi:glycosyltransferase involved in cell wall biosynthesis
MNYIVIPAHNEEQFIALTLDSLISQTLLPKKVVIVNDNSTDKSRNSFGLCQNHPLSL